MSRALRYERLFAHLRRRGEGAFVPFTLLGDPDAGRSAQIVRLLADAGADAIELGLPFSDPIADGPVLQAASARALAAGVRPGDCWRTVRTLRDEHPEMPIGILAYANLVLNRGAAAFYGEAARAGADSVLVADLPLAESAPIAAVARAHGIAPVFIIPPNVSSDRVRAIAGETEGFTYVTTRAGVTGGDAGVRREAAALLELLAGVGAPPPLLGFGIATPEQVRAALALGAAGAICGSAIARRVADLAAEEEPTWRALTTFVREMKAATREPPVD